MDIKTIELKVLFESLTLLITIVYSEFVIFLGILLSKIGNSLANFCSVKRFLRNTCGSNFDILRTFVSRFRFKCSMVTYMYFLTDDKILLLYCLFPTNNLRIRFIVWPLQVQESLFIKRIRSWISVRKTSDRFKKLVSFTVVPHPEPKATSFFLTFHDFIFNVICKSFFNFLKILFSYYFFSIMNKIWNLKIELAYC